MFNFIVNLFPKPKNIIIMNKKNFNLLLIVGILFFVMLSSCKKDDSTTSGPAAAIGPVPTTFTQKAMIEEVTGTGCSWCVLGMEGIQTAMNANPGKVCAISLHGYTANDPMNVPECATLNGFTGNGSYPHFQLNRGTGGGFSQDLTAFPKLVATALTSTVAECGLAIDAKKSSGNDVSFIVHAGFKSALTGDYRLVVYLVEDEVQNADPLYNQNNVAVSGNVTYKNCSYYSLPPTLTNFIHKHVGRKCLNASLIEGDQIPAANVKAGKEYTKTYTYTITSAAWNSANMSVIACILKYDAVCTNQRILNSQTVKLGSAKNWD